MIRLANAPVSYGAFELTVGVLPNVPGPELVLDAVAAAGYEGIELGPPGYLGTRRSLRARLERRGLALAGGFVQIRFGEADETLAPLDETLELLAAAGGQGRPVLSDGASRGAPLDWPRFADGVARASARARERGFRPTFHHHMGSRVESPAEIERLLELTDVGLLLDTGHLLAGGGDPLAGLRDWRDRIDHLHVKDVRLDVLRAAPDWPAAWSGGVFCALGDGDLDLDAFFAELGGYDGWLVVEQDWVPGLGEDPARAIADQVRNRRRLERHGFAPPRVNLAGEPPK